MQGCSCCCWDAQASGELPLLMILIFACLHPLGKGASVPLVPFGITALPQDTDLQVHDSSVSEGTAEGVLSATWCLCGMHALIWNYPAAA